MANENQDVFGISSRIGGAWSLDGAVIKIDGGDFLIVNSINITYQRRSQKFSPLNQSRKYLAIGEADGSIRMGLIIGPHAAIKDFLKKYSDTCLFQRNVIKVTPSGIRQNPFAEGDCGKKFANIYFECTGCIINTINISIQQSGSVLTVVNAGIDMQFISLKVGPNAVGNAGANEGGGANGNGLGALV